MTKPTSRIAPPATGNRKPATPRTHFTIPVFPHVKKFILKNTSQINQYYVKIEEYNTVGKIITMALREKRMNFHNDQYRDRLTEKITIIITKEQAKLGPRLSKLLRINIDIDRLFKEHLITWIAALDTSGIPPHTSCQMFLDYYAITENEYKFASTYKYWQRYGIRTNDVPEQAVLSPTTKKIYSPFKKSRQKNPPSDDNSSVLM